MVQQKRLLGEKLTISQLQDHLSLKASIFSKSPAQADFRNVLNFIPSCKTGQDIQETVKENRLSKPQTPTPFPPIGSGDRCGRGSGDPKFFLHIPSIWVKIWFYTENHLLRLSGTALNVFCGVTSW